MEDVLIYCVLMCLMEALSISIIYQKEIKRLLKRCRIEMLFSNPINLSLSWTWLLRLQQLIYWELISNNNNNVIWSIIVAVNYFSLWRLTELLIVPHYFLSTLKWKVGAWGHLCIYLTKPLMITSMIHSILVFEYN